MSAITAERGVVGKLALAQRYHCRVLVIGSGVSGYCAAIQAGRLGSVQCVSRFRQGDEK